MYIVQDYHMILFSPIYGSILVLSKMNEGKNDYAVTAYWIRPELIISTKKMAILLRNIGLFHHSSS